MRRYMELLTNLRAASFSVRAQRLGPEGSGLLSFPRPGTSIALDLPLRANTQEHIDRMNEFVIREGGRIYLTKDSLSRPEHVQAMEPQLFCLPARPAGLGSGATSAQRSVGAPAGRSTMNIVLLGATKGMGRALARATVPRERRPAVPARPARRRSGADWTRSFGARRACAAGTPRPGWALCDLENPATFAPPSTRPAPILLAKRSMRWSSPPACLARKPSWRPIPHSPSACCA